MKRKQVQSNSYGPWRFVDPAAFAPALASLRCARPGQVTGKDQKQHKAAFNFGVD